MLHRDTCHVRDSRDVALGHRAVVGLFTAEGHKLLELVASGCRLASVKLSSVDAWSQDPLSPPVHDREFHGNL